MLKRPIAANFFQNISYRKKYADGLTRYSFTDSNRFYVSAKRFIDNYLDMTFDKTSKNMIADHFLLPHNLYRVPHYFSNDEIRVIVVDRDPRDVYVDFMKHWSDLREEPAVPYRVEEFVTFWEDVRKIETPANFDCILRIHFEDLFYNYSATVSKIEQFCGLEAKDHINPGKFFNRNKSADNLKHYSSRKEWETEVNYIERHLSSYLYNFPECAV